MAAINSKDLAKYTGILEVRESGSAGAFTRLASVTGLTANIDTTNIVDIKADDTGSVLKVTDVQSTITATLLESMGRDTLSLLFTGVSADVAGVLVSGATQTIASGGTAFNAVTPIENQNGDASAIVINSVTGATDGALVADTDYVLAQDIDGSYGVVILDSATVTTMAQDFTIDYDYTPNASEDISIDIDSSEVKNFEVKVTATDGANDRVITLSSAAFTATYGMSFQDVIEAGAIAGSDVTFTGNKGSVFNYSNAIL